MLICFQCLPKKIKQSETISRPIPPLAHSVSRPLHSSTSSTLPPTLSLCVRLNRLRSRARIPAGRESSWTRRRWVRCVKRVRMSLEKEHLSDDRRAAPPVSDVTSTISLDSGVYCNTVMFSWQPCVGIRATLLLWQPRSVRDPTRDARRSAAKAADASLARRTSARSR